MWLMEHPAAELAKPDRAGSSLLIERPRLERRLDDAFGRRLTTVVADSGYGKSTLLSQWAADVTCCWYTASARDGAVSSFAAGIAEALRDHLPDLPVQFAAALAGGLEELERAELLAALMGESLGGSLKHDLILVVDDAHELVPAESSLRLIESFCRQAPPTLHLVLASREKLPLRVDRLRGQGHVLELTAAELAFTLDEVEMLTVATLGGEELAARILDATGGWPAALRLVMESLRLLPPGARSGALERLRDPGSPLFSYLAREVFEREPPEVRALIRRVAPLERFTVELCEALGLVRPREVVDGLLQRGLFLHEQHAWLSLHALVREFALAVWPLEAQEERSIQARAASWFESKGRLEDAVHAFAAASQYPEVARLLAARGSVLLASAGGDSVVRCVEMLPARYRSRSIEQLLGEALLARSDFEGALAAFERAGGNEEHLDAGLAWRIAMTHHLRAGPVKTLEPYSRARCNSNAPADEAILLGWAASAHALHGHLEEAATLAGRALELARSSDDARALASAHVGSALVAIQRGRNDLVDDHLNAALTAAERAGDIQQLLRIRTNRASVLVDRGSYAAALGELDLAVDRAETVGFAMMGRPLTNRGGAHLRMGLLDEAAADYAAVVKYSWNTGSRELAAGLMGLGSVYCERGDLAPARAALEQALPLAEETGDQQVLVATLFHLARVLVDEAPNEAARLATRAAALEGPEQPEALTAVGWLALARGAKRQAAESARRAAELARRLGQRFALAEALELAVFAAPNPTVERRRLEEALVIWRELDSRVRIAVAELALARLSEGTEAHAAAERAERRLRSLGVRISATGPAGLLRTIAQPAPVPLKIQTLGGFLVLRDGLPISLSDWRSRKARDLLKILVARRGRATPRDFLGETLWPDGDPEKLGNRLSVALSTLRSVLDPEKRFEAEHFLRADADSAAIDLEHVLVDAEAFLREAASGLALRAEGRDNEASERLEHAESSYAGDFLDEDLYADWAVPLREESRAAYISTAHALAEDAASTGDREGAIRYFLRILSRDAYDETAHLGLVSALEAAGRHGEARRAYRTYVARMEEIGAAPAAFPRL
jgi:ATP/maltotriose-dependent transcriptional regulator MalT/DNA-binding SARP family transcriptional activator